MRVIMCTRVYMCARVCVYACVYECVRTYAIHS